MSEALRNRARALSLEALGLPVDARNAFLHQACKGDAALRAEVEAALRTSETCAAMPDRPRMVPADFEPRDMDMPAGSRLGAWRITRLVGRGGMGEVYEAQRADGTFELRAAVKLLKRGLDTEAVVARFNRERRILAQLDHPNVAHVLDAGVAPDGRPFLVMEYVDGKPITQYVRDKDLSNHDLLQLTITVCEAVQAAHSKKIVHRDLKPSNVLVTSQGQVKLLDFGIAKALAEGDDNEATRLGECAAMTPSYAAPEQLLGLPATPASDVYALGCVLYQLLVERLPHLRDGRSIMEITRDLSRETIERPSVVLRKARGQLPEPLRLARLKSIPRDLDLIVLKALHTEPQRRYGSARELADDLQRLLDHRPVLARPDSLVYRGVRFIRRNRVLAASATAVILALSAGLTAALLARNEAVQRRQQADDLIGFMLGDLSERLNKLGKLEVIDAATSKAMVYLDRSGASGFDDKAMVQRVQGLIAVSQIQLLRGQAEAAMATSRRAIDGANSMTRRISVRADTALLAAQAQRALAAAAVIVGDEKEALPAIDAARQWLSRALAASPDNPEAVFLDGVLHDDLARLISHRKDTARAAAEYGACAERLKDLAFQSGAKSPLLRTYIECREGHANLLAESGQTIESVLAMQSLTREATKLLSGREDEDVPLLEADLAVNNTACTILISAGHPELADDLSRHALQLAHRLVAHDPSNADWRRGLGTALDIRATVDHRKRDWTGEEADGGEGVRIRLPLLNQNPEDSVMRWLTMRSYNYEATGSANQGKLEAAFSDLDAEIALSSTDQSPPVQLAALEARLKRWMLTQSRDPGRSAAERASAEQAMSALASRDLSHSRYVAQWLERLQMDFAYLDGNMVEADRLYVRMRDANDGSAMKATKDRNEYCAHLKQVKGLQCPVLKEWEPPDLNV